MSREHYVSAAEWLVAFVRRCGGHCCGHHERPQPGCPARTAMATTRHPQPRHRVARGALGPRPGERCGAGGVMQMVNYPNGLTKPLKPCPFCGGEAEFERRGTGRQSCIVACTECGCRLETSETWSSGQAWNQRHENAAALGVS